MSSATSRAKATLIAVNLLRQVILDVNEEYNVDIVCVSGNESRIREDIGYTDKMITDNFDFTIFNILSFLFKDFDRVHPEMLEIIMRHNGIEKAKDLQF